MRMRLRYALPGAQMISCGLLRWSDWWFNKFSRFDDMPSPPLPFKLCMSINAPAGPLEICGPIMCRILPTAPIDLYGRTFVVFGSVKY